MADKVTNMQWQAVTDQLQAGACTALRGRSKCVPHSGGSACSSRWPLARAFDECVRAPRACLSGFLEGADHIAKCTLHYASKLCCFRGFVASARPGHLPVELRFVAAAAASESASILLCFKHKILLDYCLPPPLRAAASVCVGACGRLS